MTLDAIVLADAEVSAVRIAGLSVRDRAAKIAARVGAKRVLVIDRAAARAEITAWREGFDCPLLVIRADQLVHTPLVAPLVAAIPEHGLVIAVDGDNDYAGAFIAAGDAAARAIEALARGDSDTAIATASPDARIPHADIARHPIDTPEQRRGAHDMLFRLLIKPQDNSITRYLFRPISSRISRVLVRTPATATQVSIVVAILVALGCWMTLDPRTEMMIGGALVILVASYLDCCDGEIARVKLQASTFGAWLDTIVDELSSIGYMVAIGWHCHLAYGRNYFGDLGFDPWLAGIWIGLATYGWSLFGIYYNIIVGVGSANSQDYTSRFVIVPGKHGVRLAPRPPAVAREWPKWAAPIIEFLPNLVRRDFIVWISAFYAVVRIPHVSFATHVVGGVVSFIVVTLDHFHLRSIRHAARRQGTLESPR